MAILSSFLAGIVAAFTPCIIVLFPALVYRFTNTKKENLAKELILFTGSFIGTFFIVAMFLSELLSSTVKQGFQLGIGLIFIVLGVLALAKKFNPLHFPLIKNPLLFGILFAIIASVNPCSFAYLGIIAATNSAMLVVSFVVFSIGLLIPSLLFALFGKALFAKVKNTQKILKHVNNMMNVLLIVMGGYLMVKITDLGISDIYMASVLLGLTFVILLRSFYFFYGKLSISKVILIIALIVILSSALWHCGVHVDDDEPFEYFPSTTNESEPTCSSNIEDCEVCQRCTITFGLATLLGFGAILGTHLARNKKFSITKKK